MLKHTNMDFAAPMFAKRILFQAVLVQGYRCLSPCDALARIFSYTLRCQ